MEKHNIVNQIYNETELNQTKKYRFSSIQLDRFEAFENTEISP